MCLPYYLERRSRKSWELVVHSSQPSIVALAIKKFLRYKEKHLSLCVNNLLFIFFWNYKLPVR